MQPLTNTGHASSWMQTAIAIARTTLQCLPSVILPSVPSLCSAMPIGQNCHELGVPLIAILMALDPTVCPFKWTLSHLSVNRAVRRSKLFNRGVVLLSMLKALQSACSLSQLISMDPLVTEWCKQTMSSTVQMVLHEPDNSAQWD